MEEKVGFRWINEMALYSSLEDQRHKESGQCKKSGLTAALTPRHLMN